MWFGIWYLSLYMMTEKMRQLLRSRKRLAEQMPDPATVLVGSLLSRMIHCYKPGCRYCQKSQGRGHGPIWILSISQGNRRVRQITISAEWRKEVEEGLRRHAEIQRLLKQIAGLNQELLEERRKR